MTTAADVIARARSAIGMQTVYRMGGGAHGPEAPLPAGEDGSCDCSAFVAWVLGFRKFHPEYSWLMKLNGGWLNTDGIWWDATHEPTGHFAKLERAEPGCVLVYPSAKVGKWPGPDVGHIGIVTAAEAGHATAIVHCSSGNFRKTGDAIQETTPAVFERIGSCVPAWCALVAREEATP